MSFRMFVLQEIDMLTGSASAEMRIRISNLAGLQAILGDADLDGTYDLDVVDLVEIGRLCEPPLALDSRLTVLEPWHPIRDLPYLVHTGFELPLMLDGRKPLAVFSDVWPAAWLEDVLKRFEPHVQAGCFVQRIADAPLAHAGPVRPGDRRLRRILFALPAEAWRIDAYLALWNAEAGSGWTMDSERREGTLLGYEDWQNDWWMEHGWLGRSEALA